MLDELLDREDNNRPIDSDAPKLPPHQRCAAHILNLIASKDSMAALDNDLYKRKHDAVQSKLKKWYRRQNQSEMVATTIQEGLGVKLEVPVETRWNSEFDTRRQVYTF